MQKNVFFLVIFFIGCTSNISNAYVDMSYQKMNACDKQETLWKNIATTEHQTLPPYAKLGPIELIKMAKQGLKPKIALNSDISPEGWVKYLHKRGVVAKVKIVSTNDHPYTGVFKGSECSLLRLSLTFNPGEEKDFAPGLALKVLRDSEVSSNVSALYQLAGQKRDFNFFKNSLSNIVPMDMNLGKKLVHWIFSKVTSYPEELLLNDFGDMDETGAVESKPKSPRQIFFVPNKTLTSKYSSEAHDMRNDLLNIPSGTKIYDIYAGPEKPSDFNYASDYAAEDIAKFEAQSKKIGEVISTSSFIASEFGDTGLFFRHEARKKYKK